LSIVGRSALRTRWNLIASLILLVAATCCGGVSFGGADSPGFAVFPALVLLVLVTGAVRVLFVGVVARPDHLLVRELFFSRKLPWQALRPARLGVRSYQGRTSAMPVLRYLGPSGGVKEIYLTSLGALRRSNAERNVNRLNEFISSRGGDPDRL
jgi:hypothetical protein